MNERYVDFESGLDAVEILKLARVTLFNDWQKEVKKVEHRKNKLGGLQFAERKAEKYKKQLKEVDDLLAKYQSFKADFEILEIREG